MKPTKRDHLKQLKIQAYKNESAENDPKTTNQDYRLTVESAVMHAILRTDENGVIVQWNTGAENMLKFSRNDIIGMHISIIFTEEDIEAEAHVAEMEGALKDGYMVDERWHRRKDKTLFWGAGMTTPVYGDTGSLVGFVKLIWDRTSEKLTQERISHISRHDGLTGLPNRQMFHDELLSALEHARTTKANLELLFIDLDHFKFINDTFGHHVGDLFLKQVAKRLRHTVRSGDLVARLSGDEFGIICKQLGQQTDAKSLAEKLIHELAQPYMIEGKEIRSSASIGVTTYPRDSEESEQLLKNADIAMYAAKNDGRSTCRTYSADLDQDAKRRRALQIGLKNAIANDELTLYYQPQYSIDGRTVHSVEALLRWENCPFIDVTPIELIRVAEETGQINILGEWALRKACQQACQWIEGGYDNFRVAVNISGRQIMDPTFLQMVDSILDETGLAPEYLGLEITEAALMDNNQANSLMLQSLKKLGIHVSVDHFGTGFSSLGSLQSFPVDALKIDCAFVSRLPQSKHDEAIASAIIGLAHSLNMRVVAECIETREQADCLSSLGCDLGQGYFYAAPVPPAQMWR